MARKQQTNPKIAAQAQAMGEMGYSGAEISAELAINPKTVWGILNRQGHWGKVSDTPEYREYRTTAKRNLRASLEVIANKALIQTEARLSDNSTSAYQAWIIADNAIKNQRLMDNEPTEITEHVNRVELQDRDAILAKVMASMVDVTPQPASTNTNTDTDTETDITPPTSSDHNKP